MTRQRNTPVRIRVIDWDCHRNGICGAPFHVVIFEDVDDENTRKVGILFDAPHHCAVLDIGKLSAGNITFGINSYRGDVFEEALRSSLRSPKQST
jgi:hypothetical protein